LANYVSNTDLSGHQAFVVEATSDGVIVDEGLWDQLAASGWWQHECELNDLSHAWDDMIQCSAENALEDRRWFAYPHDSFGDSEHILRFMARESRVRRRTLARMWLESLIKSKPDETYTRCIIPPSTDDTHWVFVFVPRLQSLTYDEYRERRAAILESQCRLLRHRHPDAKDIIGIAGESGLDHVGRSEDLMYFNGRLWSEEDEKIAEELAGKKDGVVSSLIIPAEYNERPPDFLEALTPSVYEGLCPCGSGESYGQCHAGAT
jgi:hypothetical protein